MKKIVAAALCLAAVLCIFTACKKKQEDPVDLPKEPDTQQGDTTQIPNPMVEVTSSNDFEPLAVYISAPQGAEDVRYYTISGTIAEIRFKFANAQYNYRASLTDEDISGVYNEFKENPGVYPTGDEAQGTAAQITVKTTDEGGKLCTWSLEGVSFSLFTEASLTDEEVVAVCNAVTPTDLAKTLALLRNLK